MFVRPDKVCRHVFLPATWLKAGRFRFRPGCCPFDRRFQKFFSCPNGECPDRCRIPGSRNIPARFVMSLRSYRGHISGHCSRDCWWSLSVLLHPHSRYKELRAIGHPGRYFLTGLPGQNDLLCCEVIRLNCIFSVWVWIHLSLFSWNPAVGWSGWVKGPCFDSW